MCAVSLALNFRSMYSLYGHEYRLLSAGCESSSSCLSGMILHAKAVHLANKMVLFQERCRNLEFYDYETGDTLSENCPVLYA